MYVDVEVAEVAVPVCVEVSDEGAWITFGKPDVKVAGLFDTEEVEAEEEAEEILVEADV